MALVAEALADLGVERAWVLRSDDGLDELSIAATSAVIEVQGGELRRFKVTPEEAGLERRAGLTALRAALRRQCCDDPQGARR